MFCITGLGNPGTQYQQTRHNAGFLVIDQMARMLGIEVNKNGFQSIYGKGNLGSQAFFLIKPQTFMNLSGQALAAIIPYYKIPLDGVLVIYDDLDLPLGKIRFRASGSAGGHRGLASIINSLGTNHISRLRIGIGRPTQEKAVVDYVLTPFNGPEQELFGESITKAAEAACSFVTEGPLYVMNHFNSSDLKVK